MSHIFVILSHKNIIVSFVIQKMKPFIPNKLPLENLNWTELIQLLGLANRELARYDGILQSIPNPIVLLSPLTTQEAVLSSKIEGTQATLQEVLRFEAQPERSVKKHTDILEILNYRQAMGYAVKELENRPISLNLVKKMHSLLLENVRGQKRGIGKFRNTQNWIGKPGSKINEARFIPPAPLNLLEYLDNFEKYIHFEDKDKLVQLAIIHAQFEIIHPFIDGNGRIGRILIPLFLFEKKILNSPMFYISSYLERNITKYYDRLIYISDNNTWEEWIKFFLNAIILQSKSNSEKAKHILNIYDEMKKRIVDKTHSQFSIQILDCLFHMPIFSSSDFQRKSNIPKPSANRILNQLKDAKIVDIIEEGKGRRPTIFIFKKLIKIID